MLPTSQIQPDPTSGRSWKGEAPAEPNGCFALRKPRPFRVDLKRLVIIFALLTSMGCIPLRAQVGMNGLSLVPWEQLSDRKISPLGEAALGIRRGEWNHAETAHFVYHFFRSFVATPVSVEAEFYYRVIAKELERDTAQWERKSHIFVFEDPADWSQFQQRMSLDPWTGGIHYNGELFVIRDPRYKFKGHSLGHEVCHLIVHRFFGNGIPLWLNEGFAEYASLHAYCLYMTKRGYLARPSSPKLLKEDYLPLKQLFDLGQYPKEDRKVEAFYLQSEKLVRFMATQDKSKLAQFLDFMAKGNRVENALWKSYGARFPNLEMFETEFKTYAVKEP